MLRALSIAVVLCAAPLLHAEVPAGWRQVSPLPTPADLHDVCHGHGLYLAVARDGSVVRSRDGDLWTRVPVGTRPLRGLAFGAGRFVAVGDRSWREGTAIYSSRDGSRWTPHDAKLEVPLRAVAHSSALGLFAAVGGSGEIRTSPDGETWTKRKPGSTTSLTAVLAAAGLLVAVGDEGTVLVSRDGAIWRQRPSGTRARLEEVAHDGERFLAVGRRAILSSLDGESWQARPVALDLRGLARSTGAYVSSERGALLYSTDGVDWTRVAIPGLGFVHRVRYLNAQFLAVGEEGMILSSLDGARWTQRSSGSSEDLAGATWTGKRFVGVGAHGAVVLSLDGRRWRRGPLLRGALNAVAAGRVGAGAGLPRLVAVGERGRIFSSSDEGESWVARECGVNVTLAAVSHSLHRFLTVGAGGVLCASGDGAGWARRKLPLSCELCGVAGSAQEAVAICSDGRSLHSRDTVHWQAGGTIPGVRLRALSWGGGQYLAVGHDGAIFSSPDGRAWGARTLLAAVGAARPRASLAAAAFVADRFLAVGDGLAWGDPAGASWRLERSAGALGLRAVASGPPGLVALGERGLILLRSK